MEKSHERFFKEKKSKEGEGEKTEVMRKILIMMMSANIIRALAECSVYVPVTYTRR